MLGRGRYGEGDIGNEAVYLLGRGRYGEGDIGNEAVYLLGIGGEGDMERGDIGNEDAAISGWLSLIQSHVTIQRTKCTLYTVRRTVYVWAYEVNN